MFLASILGIFLCVYNVRLVCGQYFTKEFARADFWLANTELPEYDANRVKRSPNLCEELAIQLQKHKNLTLCLLRESLLTYNFLDAKTTFTEDSRSNVGFLTSPLHKIGYVRILGYVLGHKKSSKVDGYLLKNKLLGRVFLNGEVFYIDELVVYLPGLQESSESVIFKVPKTMDLANPYETKHRRTRDDSSKDDAKYYEGKEVHVALHLDPAWYIFPNKYCRKRAVFSVVHIVHVMNSVFRSQDFFGTGRPSNIGFYLSKIHLSKNNYKLHYAPYMASRIAATAVLDRFLKYDNIEKDKSVDMHMLYTGQEVQDGVNGFSPVGVAHRTVGGVCAETRNGMFINTFYYDYYSENGKEQHYVDAASAHEMAHSFGAFHDPPDDAGDDDPEEECRYYLLSPINNKTINFVKGFTFSPCSIKKILPVLADPARRKCFHDPPTDRLPFCGNRMVDEGEECDCGNKYLCKATEDCCNSYDSTTGPPCTYRVDKSDCKPPEGLCCTGTCQFRNLSHVDLACGPHCLNGCPCGEGDTSCACGIGGRCLDDECHSEECTRLGLRECMCPTVSTGGCRTCCEIDRERQVECMEAYKATQVMLGREKVRWEDLEKSAVKSREIKTAVYRKVCSGGGGKCIWLMFRLFPHGEYCLSQGHVGKCTVHSICLVENEILHKQDKITKIFKKIRRT